MQINPPNKRRHSVSFLAFLLSLLWLFVAIMSWGRGYLYWDGNAIFSRDTALVFRVNYPQNHYWIKLADRFEGNSTTLYLYLVLGSLPCCLYALTELLPQSIRTFFPTRKRLRVAYWIVASVLITLSVLCLIGSCTGLFSRYDLKALAGFLPRVNLDLLTVGVVLSIGCWMIPCALHWFKTRSSEHTARFYVQNALIRTALSIVCAFLITIVSCLILVCVRRFYRNAFETVQWICINGATDKAAFVSMLVAAPLIEELAFRGMIQRCIRKNASAWASILITALFFGLWHRNTGQFIYTFAFALLVGWVYEFTGKIRYTWLIHAGMNLISILCYSTADNAVFGTLHLLPGLRDALMGLPVWGAALIIPVLVIGLVLIVRLFRETDSSKK